MPTLANSEDPDEMPHNAAFYLCLQCLLRQKQFSAKEIHFENYNMLPLIYTMDHPKFIVLNQQTVLASCNPMSLTYFSWSTDFDINLRNSAFLCSNDSCEYLTLHRNCPFMYSFSMHCNQATLFHLKSFMFH